MNVYEEFDYKCRQKGLSEVFKTKSQDTYFLMKRMFDEKKIKYLGIGNDWECEYEIRFSIH